MINVNTLNAVGEITEIMSRYNENIVKPIRTIGMSKEELKEFRKKWEEASNEIRGMKVVTKIGVTIISTNDKRYEHNYIETDTLLSATRIMNTFKPKRGYRAISFKVEEVEVLV